MTGRTGGAEKGGIMGVFLLLPFPLIRYQPSGSSIILDPIFLKTVKILLSLSLSLNPNSAAGLTVVFFLLHQPR